MKRSIHVWPAALALLLAALEPIACAKPAADPTANRVADSRVNPAADPGANPLADSAANPAVNPVVNPGGNPGADLGGSLGGSSGGKPFERRGRSLLVTATAYNSHPDQTQDHPQVAAWGDWIAPGMKVIAVSRDLIELGLDHQTPVLIEGFAGEYVVLDKMHARWSKRIDIYMGDDVEAAREWGARQVEIQW